MANRRFTQFFQTLHSKPVLLDCAFTVNSADSAGKGITGLVGPGIQNVFMKTSATKASGSPGGSTGPAAGLIYVQLQDNYNFHYGSEVSFRSPNSGSDIAVTAAGALLTAGQVYSISVLGTTTAANWVTLGLPIGTAAAVGVSFIASATGAGTGTGKVQRASASAIDNVERVGSANLSIKSTSATIAGQTNGSYLIFQCLAGGVVTAPTNGSVAHIWMYFNNGSTLNKGE